MFGWEWVVANAAGEKMTGRLRADMDYLTFATLEPVTGPSNSGCTYSIGFL